jgi:polygalacturonase
MSTFRIRFAAVLAIALAAMPFVPTTASATTTVTPSKYGAVGDGKHDDSAALKSAIAALHPGDILSIPAGKVYAHSQMLTIRTAGVTVVGSGELLATTPASAAIVIAADRVTLRNGLVIAASPDGVRSGAAASADVVIAGHVGDTINGIAIRGSSASGIHVGDGASGFLIENSDVQDTAADGIYITGASHDGKVLSNVVRRAGDDSFSVVSYTQDPAACHNILFDGDQSWDNRGGRGVAIVGGTRVAVQDFSATRASGAGVYVASESTWNTRPVEHIYIDDVTLTQSNRSPLLDDGAIFVINSQPALSSHITVINATVVDTSLNADRQIVVAAKGPLSSVFLGSIAVRGGPARTFWSDVATGWAVNDLVRDGAELNVTG